VLVEFALVFPILAMLLIGLVSSARLYDANLELSHATREGARYGATMPADQVFASGTWATNVRQRVLNRAGTSLSSSQVCVALIQGSPGVAVSSGHTTAGGASGCYDDSASGETELRVQVSTTRTVAFDALIFSRDITLDSRATIRHEFD
jgi:Flp pilus assembly protein TadG